MVDKINKILEKVMENAKNISQSPHFLTMSGACVFLLIIMLYLIWRTGKIPFILRYIFFSFTYLKSIVSAWFQRSHQNHPLSSEQNFQLKTESTSKPKLKILSSLCTGISFLGGLFGGPVGLALGGFFGGLTAYGLAKQKNCEFNCFGMLFQNTIYKTKTI